MAQAGPELTSPRHDHAVTEAEKDYFRSIEERFAARRGRPLILSPADVARATDWFRQGIPVEAVLEAIEVHFERLARREREPRRAVTLAYLEDEVTDAWAGAKRRRLGSRPRTESEPALHALATRAEHARLAQALREAASRLAAGGDADLAAIVERALGKLEAKAELFDETAATHDDERAEDHLRRLEKSMLDKAREAIGAEAAGQLEQQAAAALAGKLERMDERARERAAAQLMDRSLRERLGVPRLSLFYA